MGIVTEAVVPLNVSAPPNLPDVVHAALPIEPVFPLPDVSATAVPVPSLKEYSPTKPENDAGVVALAGFEYGLRLPARSPVCRCRKERPFEDRQKRCAES